MQLRTDFHEKLFRSDQGSSTVYYDKIDERIPHLEIWWADEKHSMPKEKTDVVDVSPAGEPSDIRRGPQSSELKVA